MDKSDTVAIIRSLLSSTKSSYSISNLNKEFKNETGMDIPLFGYSTISDFLHSIPHTVKVSGIYPVENISLVANEKSSHIVSLVKRQKCAKQRKKVPPVRHFSKKTRLITGFRCTEVQESQNVTVKENRKDFEGKNLKDFNGKDYKNFKGRDKENRGLVKLGPACLRNNLCTNERVSLIDLNLHASVGEYIEVYPCEVLGPHKFFFHLRKFKKKLRCFMNKLQVFYEGPEKIPNLDPSLIRHKQICAVFHKIHSEPKWYRAEIDEVVDNVCVIVNFIDIGRRANVLKKNLKYLHKNFLSLPRQACVGFLANIKPLKMKSEWSSFAIQRFIDLALEKNLVAGVVHVDAKANCIGMALSLTIGKEIHINDTLVNEGFAKFEIKVWDRKPLVTSSEGNLLHRSTDETQLFTEKKYNRQNAMESLKPRNLESHKSEMADSRREPLWPLGKPEGRHQSKLGVKISFPSRFSSCDLSVDISTWKIENAYIDRPTHEGPGRFWKDGILKLLE